MHRRLRWSERQLHCNPCLSLQSGRAGRNAHYDRSGKIMVRLIGQPGGPSRCAARRATIAAPPAPTEGRTRPRAEPPGPGRLYAEPLSHNSEPSHHPSRPASVQRHSTVRPSKANVRLRVGSLCRCAGSGVDSVRIGWARCAELASPGPA